MCTFFSFLTCNQFYQCRVPPCSQVSWCILAMGSGTVKRDWGSCSPKTWPPAMWCYPAAAWWKRCSPFNLTVKWSPQHIRSAPLMLQRLLRLLGRDNVRRFWVIIDPAWFYLLSPTCTVLLRLVYYLYLSSCSATWSVLITLVSEDRMEGHCSVFLLSTFVYVRIKCMVQIFVTALENIISSFLATWPVLSKFLFIPCFTIITYTFFSYLIF